MLKKIIEKLKIRFVEETHKYYVADKEIPSATTIISKVLGNPFAKETIYMRQARDKGTMIHKAISDFIVDGKEPEFIFPEFDNFLELSKKHDIVWDLSEQIIYNNIDNMEYAGTLDLFSIENEEISDIKTGSTKAIKKWQIQLSMYAQSLRDIFGLKVSKGSILWLHNEESEYIPIELLDKEAIREFLTQYYYPKEETEQDEELTLECLNPKAIKEFNNILSAMDAMKEKIDSIKGQIKAEMERRNINQIKIGNRVISYVNGTTKESIDSKKLKEEYPEVWDKCKKVSKVNASIRIK